MTVHYKNKRISRAVLAGIFLAAAGLLWGIRDVYAGTEVKVGTEAAGGIFFYDTETERNIYLTRNLYFKYGYTSNGITQGHVTAVLNGATYNPANGSYEIGRVIAPGVYNFHLTYSVSGSEKSDPICWSAWIGYHNYQHTVYIYDCRLPYVKISYGQTINGTITVSDVGQSIKLEAVSGYNQTSYSGIQFPQKLVARAIKSDGQLVSGKQVVFSLKSGPQPDPQAAFTNPSATTASDGTVETFFTLSGPTYYPYTIRAYCADCPLQQEALFTETLVEKTHVLQKLPDGDNQTWLVGETLPKQLSVKVVDSQNNPVDGVDIRFSVSAPQQGDWSFPGNVKEITTKTDKGVAKTDFKLGTAAGDYTVDATCAICAVGNNKVSFTATALTNVVELRKISGDGTMPVGEQVINPLKVQAFNTLTNKGEPGFDVDFSIVSVPAGGDTAAIGAPHVVTNKYGIASSSFTLGKSEGDYVVKARCESCQRNREVFFTVTGRAPIEDEHPSEEGDKTAFPPDTSVLQIAFQNTKMRESNSFKAVTRGDSRIGVLKIDVIKFKGFIAPTPDPPLLESDYVWSGAVFRSGKTIEIPFNNLGAFDLTLTVKGKTRTVKITVAEINSTLSDSAWRKEPSNWPFVHIVLSCGLAAKVWAANYGYQHNDVSDAMQHAYWNACITNTVSAEVAASATNAHEYTNEHDENSPHNENVMDLENNAIGRNIGGSFPYLIGAVKIQEEIKTTAKNGNLTVIDFPSNAMGAGLLIPSR